MRDDTTSHLLHRFHDDPLVSLLTALLGYAVGSILVAVVSSASAVRPLSWIMLVVTLGAAILLAAQRRQARVLRFILLIGCGTAGVAVGIVYPLYKATEYPGWLLSSGAVICYACAVSGAIMLLATRDRSAGMAVPPNKPLERTREG